MGQSSTHVQAISKRPPTQPSAYKSGRRQATQPKMHPSNHKSYASKAKNRRQSPRSATSAESNTCVEIPVQRKGWDVGIATKFNGTNRPRVCRTRSVNNIDHTEVNNCPLKAIMRPHYPMRTLDYILPQISEAKYFSKLDASSGYWTFMLSHESSLFTTFNTPFGRYRYLRLPFWTEKLKGHFPPKDR